MATDVELTIGDLVLDNENPRIVGEDAQLDILQSILDDQGSKLGELAEDIAKFGLNPMDRLMVMRPDATKDEYVALEGNRRVAALQILNNSGLLTDLSVPDALRDKLVELADDFEGATVEPIPAVLMPNARLHGVGLNSDILDKTVEEESLTGMGCKQLDFVETRYLIF